MNIPLAVAFGGALGAVARYLLSMGIEGWAGTGFPWGTLAANVVGSFLMGVVIEVSALAWSPSPELRAMLTVGVLSALTTFSTFSMETVSLLEQGSVGLATAYAAASVVVCVGGLFAGMHLFRKVLT